MKVPNGTAPTGQHVNQSWRKKRKPGSNFGFPFDLNCHLLSTPVGLNDCVCELLPQLNEGVVGLVPHVHVRRLLGSVEKIGNARLIAMFFPLGEHSKNQRGAEEKRQLRHPVACTRLAVVDLELESMENPLGRHGDARKIFKTVEEHLNTTRRQSMDELRIFIGDIVKALDRLLLVVERPGYELLVQCKEGSHILVVKKVFEHCLHPGLQKSLDMDEMLTFA